MLNYEPGKFYVKSLVEGIKIFLKIKQPNNENMVANDKKVS